MFMDPHFSEFSDALNGFEFGDEIVLPSFNQSSNLVSGFKFKDESLDLSFLDIPTHPPDHEGSPSNSTPSSGSSEMNSPDDDNEFSDGVLKFLNQILMEEKIEEKPSMFHDPLALQAAEKSFYEVLGEKYPSSPHQNPVDVVQNIETPSEYSTSNGTSIGNYVDPQWVGDTVDFKSSAAQNHSLEYFSSSTSKSSSQWSIGSGNSFSNTVNGQLDSSMRTHLIPNIFSDSESILHFKRGMEEASKFLPSSTPLVIDMDKYALLSDSKEGPPEIVVKVEKDEDISPNSSRGRKHYHRQDSVIEDERSSKQSAVYVEDEVELSEMFDKVLLCEPCCDNEKPSEVSPILHHEKGQTIRSNGVRRTKKSGSKTEAVDLRALLISCAQSVAADDRRTAYEQLKLIRQHSSPSGDASQRLADIFANSLEARMAGTGSQIYASLASKRISATEKLKAYQVYLSACPFKKISIFFANKMILERASNAKTLHIIDFGIQYGFQWPVLIQLLSKRSGGAPKLRITGIELPQPGFRPAEYMEATGRRLASYCERFNVSFEYNAIATQNWETIKVEDLKIESNEFVAVNCLLRLKNLLDETVVVNSPRDAVLKLIRKVNPDIFIHAVVNGSYSAPFFVTRFREALFHYYATFDMFDVTLPREDQQRLNFEREFCGREVMNVVACEGSERVERPKTYKQWQVHNMRAGFKLLPLNQELLKKLRCKVKAGYHKDFVFDEDGQWMLQGWKGRILCATSAWVPA